MVGTPHWWQSIQIKVLTQAGNTCAVCVTAGAIALNGDLPAVVDWVRGSILVYPARAAIAGPLLYHYIGGLRHIAWDHAKCVLASSSHREQRVQCPAMVLYKSCRRRRRRRRWLSPDVLVTSCS